MRDEVKTIVVKVVGTLTENMIKNILKMLLLSVTKS